MSGEDDSSALVTSATATMMTAVQAMFTELRKSMINNNLTISNNINDLRAEMTSSSDATRAELLERIDQRSRLSTRATTRAGSRAVSPKSLMAGVSAKLKSDADSPDASDVPQGITMTNALPERQVRPSPAEQAYVAETPRVNGFGPDLTLTQVFRDKDAADRFEEENILRRGRQPKVSNRDNTHAYRDSFNAQNRPNDPMHREQFTRTTPLCEAKLDGPLTLEKCLTFQKDVLDFQNKFNVAVRLTSYLSDDLKADMKARFDLTDSRFYTLATQDLERYLSEMIAPVCKAEFLAMLKTTVHFQLPEGYSPTEQTVTIFLYQLLVYKERMFRAVEFILLHAPSDDSLPACDTKPQGLLKLISDEVPHRFIALILESDPPGTKYKDIYKFFTRVAIHTKRCEALHQESQVFRHSFGGSRFEKAQREAIAGSSRLIDTTTPTTTIEDSDWNTVQAPMTIS